MSHTICAFTDGYYKEEGPLSGTIDLIDIGFELQFGSSNSNHYSHATDEIFSLKVYGSDTNKPHVEINLLTNSRELFSVRFNLDKPEGDVFCTFFSKKAVLKTVGSKNPCRMFVKQSKKSITTLLSATKSPAMGLIDKAYYNHGLDLLYTQLSGKNLSPVSLRIIDTETGGKMSLAGSSSRDERGPVDASGITSDNEALFQEYVKTIASVSNYESGRALVECLFINTIYRQREEKGKAPKTLGELREFIAKLKAKYKSMVDNWVSVDQKMLTNEFNNDINVIAKDVVRTEKNSPYVRPDFTAFEKRKARQAAIAAANKRNNSGTEDDKTAEQASNDEEDNDNGHGNTPRVIDQRQEGTAEGPSSPTNNNNNNSSSSSSRTTNGGETRDDHPRKYILEDNSQDMSRLNKIVRSSITVKFLLPFLAKEAAEKDYITVPFKESEIGYGQVPTERLISSLTETDYEDIVSAYSSQIRMFNLLVTCFMNDPPISYVQGMNDFVGSFCEQTVICAAEGQLFGAQTDIESIEAMMYFIFCYILNLHKRAFSTQPLNGSMSVLQRFGQAICEINPALYCVMQRTDYDSILLYLLNPYLLFFRREVESGAASIRLICESLESDLGYNYLFVLLLAYVDITIVPSLSKAQNSKGERPEPLLPMLSQSAKTDSRQLLDLARRYMKKKSIESVLRHFFGRHYLA